MKPKDLISPYSWENRHTILSDGVLFVPDYYQNYDEYQFPGWDHQDIFGNNNPVKLEYCSGNGSWIVEKAMNEPDVNWVAVEIRFDRVRKIWAKKKNRGLNNLFIICGEALTFAHHYLPDSSICEIFVNFPDPWPKDRHAKHRLIRPRFIEENARCLKSNAMMTLVTDDEVYCTQMIDTMLENISFRSCYPEPYFITDVKDYGSSFFCNLWENKGKTIRHMQFMCEDQESGD